MFLTAHNPSIVNYSIIIRELSRKNRNFSFLKERGSFYHFREGARRKCLDDKIYGKI